MLFKANTNTAGFGFVKSVTKNMRIFKRIGLESRHKIRFLLDLDGETTVLEGRDISASGLAFQKQSSSFEVGQKHRLQVHISDSMIIPFEFEIKRISEDRIGAKFINTNSVSLIALQNYISTLKAS